MKTAKKLHVVKTRDHFGKVTKLIYARGKKNKNPVGLDFPDNFMAVIGFKRALTPKQN